MSKKVALINDLSGFGRCSLVAGISILSTMGVQPCPFPTAILSAQTGYSNYVCVDATDSMSDFLKHWKEVNPCFQGISVGFLASERQICEVTKFLDVFQRKDTVLLVDPIMGDGGKTYDIYTPSFLTGMKQLVKKADIITPNLTEFCLLTGLEYASLPVDLEKRLNVLKQAGKAFCENRIKDCIITGIPNQIDGVEYIGNLQISRTNTHFYNFPQKGGSYSGTGDLFSSAIIAGNVLEISLENLIPKLGEFLLASIQDTLQNNVQGREGVNYEPYLSILSYDNLKKENLL